MANISNNFFLGKVFDTKTSAITPEQILLDPTNLTTHTFVTGMTGSGKTGLCIGLLEEAALHGIPAIIIDPKGDLTNLVLHFPELLPSDFEPWVDPDMARMDGKSVPDEAAATADKWKKGLGDWGLGPDQLKALKDKVDFAIYTPGSTAGLLVNILSSFETPEMDWNENSEMLRERISSTITALLELVGLTDIDPLRSREHILLASLIENAWSSKQSLSLTELILQVQNPPMDHLGAFPMDSFYPEKDRFSLSMLLNNFLASPSFQAWQSGQTLDIQALLYTPAGKARHSIFYLAHLTDKERMFFVTLLFANIETWMRGQRGTSNLRALVYFDEIMGYLPPVANPASKTVMLRMLKQARAFGVGLVLATQNPVDVDYKALSNTGTWMIGHLHTEQDKQRLLDGLSSASGAINVATYDKLISGLQKRVFLWHSVYRPTPTLFNTRWTLNYLAGPLTRTQLPALNELAGAINRSSSSGASKSSADLTTEDQISQQPPIRANAAATGGVVSSRPAVPGAISEYFFPVNVSTSEAISSANLTFTSNAADLVYRPAVFAQADVRYASRQYNLDMSRKVAAFVEDPGNGLIHWENMTITPVDPTKLASQPQPNAAYHIVPNWLSDQARVTAMGKDFLDWVFRSATIKIKANNLLKVYAGPEVSQDAFKMQCSQAIQSAMQVDVDKVNQTYDTKITALQNKIEAQTMDVKAAGNSVSQRTMEEVATGGALVLSLLSGRKRSLSSSVSKVRMTQAAKDKLEKEKLDLQNLQEQLQQLQAARNAALKSLNDKWSTQAGLVTEIPLTPTKSSIFSDVFGVAWMPYYIVKVNGQTNELPAYTR
ncbi:MAG: ATP-binding protein [Anaerolineaceae bacterium]